ncbi:MAG: hypothetical protein Unbinned6486contig1001_42 [Prokaryotic dsDNA virus sp.]|nr:MAG: hypothetical protein Unbinned6486contig1001_42 [Prokaryotic dsDNA virus sp.]|tara:strand:+ start:11010 stop:11171 length:162 start_codon:yes stop_codon:yes gene_type:complete
MIPKPKNKELNKNFINRCMVDDYMIKTYKNINQRLAVCSSRLKFKPKKQDEKI